MWHFIQIFLNSAKQERKFLLKNPWDLSVVVWLPLLTIILIWWVFSRSMIVDVPIAVVNHSKGHVSQKLIRYLDNSPDIAVTEKYTSEHHIKESILRRRIYGAVIIPADFDEKLLQGKVSNVSLQVNAQYGTHSGIIQKGVQKSVGTLSAAIEIAGLVKKGTSITEAKIEYTPIHINRMSLFNTNTNYQLFLASTVLPALLHILAMVIGTTTTGREIRDKTLGQWYDQVTQTQSEIANTKKLSKHNILCLLAAFNGKFIWQLLFYGLWGGICLALANRLHPATAEAWLLTFIAFLLLIMISFWLGAIHTLLTLSLRKGLSITGFISAPSFAFAGVTYPLIAITSSAQNWALMLPLTHYLNIHIAQLQMGAPLYISIATVCGLVIATIVLMFVCVLLTQRALNNPQRWGAR